jgi:D-arabinose 1-dehydrogenase-like Zn-dependent alcohol dehydrogenase
MKSPAAVFHAPGQPLAMREYLLPDLHSIAGRGVVQAPSVLGHCARALASQCERLFRFGHERTGAVHDLWGAFAEFCIRPAGTPILRVPPSVSGAAAAPANCATSTVAAVCRHAGELNGQNVAIIGAGMPGLTACAMVREAGAAQVLAVEAASERRKKAGRPVGSPHNRLMRVYNYTPQDLDVALNFLAGADSRYRFRELVGARFALSDIDTAIAHAESERPPRITVVVPR